VFPHTWRYISLADARQMCTVHRGTLFLCAQGQARMSQNFDRGKNVLSTGKLCPTPAASILNNRSLTFGRCAPCTARKLYSTRYEVLQARKISAEKSNGGGKKIRAHCGMSRLRIERGASAYILKQNEFLIYCGCPPWTAGLYLQ
jgi:hypothetical protein